MLINHNDNSCPVEFVKYTEEYPNLCHGALTLKIEGRTVTFGSLYLDPSKYDYRPFWRTGGHCGMDNIKESEWIADESQLPDEYKKYALYIDKIFNDNVPHGCCGGCR